jgi:arabinan endo-1,5-alpha-L-arabinosidase
MRLAVVVFLTLSLLSCGGIGPASGAGLSATGAHITVAQAPVGSYVNPVPIALPDGTYAESCPDPSLIHGQAGDKYWYFYCTNERFSDGGPVHLLPISRSEDLAHWTYVGDVFAQMPAWVARDGWLWAPDIQYFNGRYYLYYAVSNTAKGGSAIFVATSDTPTGPWTALPNPVVEPTVAGGRLRATIDPVVVEDNGRRYIFYGSFDGGISARLLGADGTWSDTSTQVQITLPDRYEAPYLIKHDGYFYLMVSAGNCCDGPLSGYGVFAARSINVLGPYLDRDGNLLLESRIGGTPVIAMSGNRWIGPGHNAVATDANGQDWLVYHAIDAAKPYFTGSWTRRPVMIDALDWVDGWPRVRTGPTDVPQPMPSMVTTAPVAHTGLAPDVPAGLLAALSDEFTGSILSAQWTWVRPPATSTYAVGSGLLRFDTQAGEIYVGHHDASLLTEPAPSSDYVVEVKLSTTVPLNGRYNFAQGGVVLYKDDSNYIKVVTVAISDTRQIEFAKQYDPGGGAQYGSTFLASPADATYFRIAKRTLASGVETYTAYSSHDGVAWERGGAWTHALGSGAKIGLISMSGAGFATYFDYVRVYGLN